MSDALDLSRLSALAQKATKGPWRAHKVWPVHICAEADAEKKLGGADTPEADVEYAQPIAEVQLRTLKFDGWERYTHRRFNRAQAHADAAFIAACSPDVILHLVQRLERIEQWAKPWTGLAPHSPQLEGYTRAQEEILRLLREGDNL